MQTEMDALGTKVLSVTMDPGVALSPLVEPTLKKIDGGGGLHTSSG